MLFRVTSPLPPRLTGAILSGKYQRVHLTVAQASQTNTSKFGKMTSIEVTFGTQGPQGCLV